MPLLSPVVPRDPHEPHRAATPLELLFDLVSVIAIASAAAGLHHAIAEDHIAEGVALFGVMFFSIWWAWMNYTWYASAYDNDDVLFRLLTFIVMSGALIMAAGVSFVFDGLTLDVAIIGYIVMRVGMVALWLRAAREDPERRTTAARYAIGIALAQVFWTALLFVPLTTTVFYVLFIVGAVIELAVPVLAEKAGETPWHRHHMIERYGLLNIIVLGETLLAASVALGAAFSEAFDIRLVHLALSALAILFSMWWLYFSREEHLETNRLHRALTWGYGHVVVFASGAAVGAGIAVLVDIVTDHAEVSLLTGDYAVAIPVAAYMLGLWFVRDRFCLEGIATAVLPTFAVLVLLAPLVLGLEGIAVLTVLSVITRNLIAARMRPASETI